MFRRLVIVALLTFIIFISQPFKVDKNICDLDNLCYLLWLNPISALAEPVNKLNSIMPDQAPNIKVDHFNRELIPLVEKNFEPSNMKLYSKTFGQKKGKPTEIKPELKNNWRKNALQLTELPPGPKIAIVIDDAGLDQNKTAAVIDLIGPMTISFLTYGRNLPEQVKKAITAGHEILVHVAMEPLDKSKDPGPNALLTGSTVQTILEQLRWDLESFNGYVGINNHMGSLFTSNLMGMEVVMRELKRRGLLFLDSRTSRNTVGASIARVHKVPFTQRNIFLDNVASIPAINKQLELMELLAKKNGHVVAIAHPRDATIQALSEWLPIMAERGFVQVPVSTIVAEQQGLSPINLGKIDN